MELWALFAGGVSPRFWEPFVVPGCRDLRAKGVASLGALGLRQASQP